MVKLIAEIGWNHMGDMSLAEDMIISAAESGADICKFQTWSERKLKNGPWDQDGRREIYRKAQLTEENHYFLRDKCTNNKVEFLTSVFNIDDVDFLAKKMRLDEIKIPSHEIYNINLIQAAMASFNKVLISTGAAKWDEITSLLKLAGSHKIVLMHCVSAYPCHPENINLPRIEKLKKLDLGVGYSGHFQGVDDAIAAICYGVSYVEKHFTIDRKLPGRDNEFAIVPEELRTLATFRDNHANMSMDLGLDLQECEKDVYNNYRGRWSDGK